MCIVFVCRHLTPFLANLLAPASDCTGNKGLLVAQASLQMTANLAQQANSLSSVRIQQAALLHKLDTTKESWPLCTHSTAFFEACSRVGQPARIPREATPSPETAEGTKNCRLSGAPTQKNIQRCADLRTASEATVSDGLFSESDEEEGGRV